MQKTIWENLTYGAEKNVSKETVYALCESLDLLAYIQGLAKGFDSVIGVDATPSGGQAQRLGIIRTLLKEHSPLLLLDEPTSELDVAGQRLVIEKLLSLRGTKTIVFITHNLAALERVDNIFFMAAGKLVENGSHAELVAKRGAYYEFLRVSFSLTEEGKKNQTNNDRVQAPEDASGEKKKKKFKERMDEALNAPHLKRERGRSKAVLAFDVKPIDKMTLNRNL